MAKPRFSRLLAGTTIGLVGLAQVLVGWTLFFSYLQWFDDEGYMVTLYREWASGGALYDEVYSQYGPFHLLVVGLPLRVLDLSLTLTSGRIITLALYVGTALLFALVVLKITGSILSAVLAQLLAFWSMWTVVTAPLHPIPLLLFLLGALTANVVVLKPRRSQLSDVVTGAIVAAILLTKVNVGVFVAVSVAYVVATTWRSGTTRRWLLVGSEVALVLMGPVLLLSQRGDVSTEGQGIFGPSDPRTLEYWALAYVMAAITVVVFARLARRGRGSARTGFSLPLLAAGFGAVAALTIGMVLLTGTSIGALVDAVVVRPLGQADALTLLPRMSGEMLVAAAAVPVLIGIGWAVARATPSHGWLATSGAVRVVGAGALLFASLADVQVELGILPFAGSYTYVALAALAVLPPVGSRPTQLTSRTFLAALAVAHTLHAFPVAGLQVEASLLVALVCGVVVLDDGVREWTELATGSPHAQVWTVAARGLVLAAILWFGWQYQDLTRSWVDSYRSGVALDLPGSRWMRSNPASVDALRQLVDDVSDCTQLVSYPGTYSLNLWSGTPPANGYNTTLWPDLLTDAEQRSIVQHLEASEDPVCFYSQPPRLGRPLDPRGGPLERYLAGFEVRTTRPGYRILVRPSP